MKDKKIVRSSCHGFVAQRLKVHYHAIQCCFVDFFFAENGGEETWGRGTGQWEAGLCHTFFSSPVPSFVSDRRRRIRQLPLQSHSSLGRSCALKYDQESENKKATRHDIILTLTQQYTRHDIILTLTQQSTRYDIIPTVTQQFTRHDIIHWLNSQPCSVDMTSY